MRIPNERVVINRADSTVTMGGRTEKVDMSAVNPLFNVVQWYGVDGIIEFTQTPGQPIFPNVKIVDFSDYLHLIDKFERAAKETDGRKQTKQEQRKEALFERDMLEHSAASVAYNQEQAEAASKTRRAVEAETLTSIQDNSNKKAATARKRQILANLLAGKRASE